MGKQLHGMPIPHLFALPPEYSIVYLMWLLVDIAVTVLAVSTYGWLKRHPCSSSTMRGRYSTACRPACKLGRIPLWLPARVHRNRVS